jgi:diguanylate cyclase (GGDEF)-like protein
MGKTVEWFVSRFISELMVPHSKFPRLPLSLILIVPYALQIIAVLGLVGWLCYQSGQETIENMAAEVSEQATNRIKDRLDIFLFKPLNTVLRNAFFYQKRKISLESPLDLQELFQKQVMFQKPMVPVVYAGDAQGRYLLVNSRDQVEISSPTKVGYRIIYSLDAQGKREKVIAKTLYDPRQRPWYKAASDSFQSIWTTPYAFASGGKGITVARAVRNQAGKVQAVMAVDLGLDVISEYLRTIKFSPSSHIYIMDSSGFIIADSLSKGMEREGKKLIPLESQDPVIRESGRYIQNTGERFNSATTISNFVLKIQGQKYFLTVLPFQYDNNNVSWQVVIAFSEKDFAKQIDLNNRATLILLVLSLILAIAVGTITSRFLTQKILRLAKTVDKISLGDLEPLPLSSSGTQEMDVLVNSFDRMVIRLRDMLKELEGQAYIDTLTGLSNRAAFLVHLQHIIAATKQASYPTFAVLLLELDSLKWIENGLGLGTADLLLKETATRLQSCLQMVDAQMITLARIERDEFAILLGNISGEQTAITAAQMMVKVFQQPFHLDQKDVVAHIHVGVVIEHGDSESPEDILRNANIARLRAKVEESAQYVVFDKPMLLSTTERLQFEADLQYALDRDEFELFYQPIVSIEAGGIAGFEALIRWQHPRLGFISPAKFIPIAEETGAIAPIGAWVLQTACQQLKLWQQEIATLRSAYVSVNVSAQQLLLPNYVEQVEQIVQEAKIDGQYIQLEITESAAVSQPEIIGQKLSRLKKLGIQMCFDDFGTGYSQLGYLTQLPVDALKIDRSFVSHIGVEGNNSEIAKTILALSRSLQLDVTAEGVETLEQYHHLRSLGCEKFQGYLFSPPIPSREVAHFCPVMPRDKVIPIS